MTRTLLIGMGNPILSDDGVGVRLAHELNHLLAPQPDVDVLEECSVGGLNLLDVVTGYDRVIVIDSIKTAGGQPGYWYRFPGSALRETMNLRNVHDANFATALELGRRMGTHVPAEQDVTVLAVEVADNLTFSERLTPELEDAVAELVAEMFAEISELITASAERRPEGAGAALRGRRRLSTSAL
jgi:hydrogenase maturation protease